MWDQLNAAVPINQEKDIDLGHEYDGIRELDNHLPPWWKGILYGSVVWAVIYMFVYHFSGSLPLSIAEYENQLAVAAEEVRVYQASQPVTVIDENALAFTDDAAILGNGKRVFKDLQARYRIKTSVSYLETEMIKEMRYSRSEDWRVMESMLSQSIRD